MYVKSYGQNIKNSHNKLYMNVDYGTNDYQLSPAAMPELLALNACGPAPLLPASIPVSPLTARRVRGAVGLRAAARSGDEAAGPGLCPSPNARRDSNRLEQWTGAGGAGAGEAVGAQYGGAVPQLPPRDYHANQYTNTILASTRIHSSLCVHAYPARERL